MTENAGRFSLGGRRALVTGASRGIGRAIALGLAEAGADVAVHYATARTSAEATAAGVVAVGRASKVAQADLTIPGAGRGLAEEILQAWPVIDLVVLNAGLTWRRPFSEITSADVALEVQFGFGSAIEILQALVP